MQPAKALWCIYVYRGPIYEYNTSLLWGIYCVICLSIRTSAIPHEILTLLRSGPFQGFPNYIWEIGSLSWCCFIMMTSSNGNIFRVTSALWGESTGHGWISLTKASDAEFNIFYDMCLNKLLSKQSGHRWFETPWRPYCFHCIALCWTNIYVFDQICTEL